MAAAIPAIFRRSAQEGVSALLPRLGSYPAAPAAGVGRLMHKGLGGSTKLPQQKALPFGGHGVLSQGHKIVRMEQLNSGRSFSSGLDPGRMTWAGPFTYGVIIGLALYYQPWRRRDQS